MKFVLCLMFVFFVPCINAECSSGELEAPISNVECAKQTLLINRTRTDLINYLIARNNYKKYLEIGVAGGDNLRLIIAENKTGVDPSRGAPCQYHMTSDEFFKYNRETFDIVFIDGMHLSEQVLRDVENSMNCLNPGGMIVMHDCMPVLPEHQSRTPPVISGPWNGDVWKAAAYIRMHLDQVHFCVLNMDWGCGVLTPNSHQTLYPLVPSGKLDWDFYVQNKKQLLNIQEVEEWVEGFRPSSN